MGVSWHAKTETDRLIGMMSAVNIAKVETAKRAGKRRSAASIGASVQTRMARRSSAPKFVSTTSARVSEFQGRAARRSSSLTAARCDRAFCRRVRLRG